MNLRNSLWIILIFLTVFSCKKREGVPSLEIEANKTSDHLIEAEELFEIQNEDNIIIVDFRKVEDYDQGHIKGAVNIWRTDIEDDSYPYKGMMAKKENVEALFSKLGIKGNDILVVYDDKGSSDASRLWWLLKSYGFDSVRLLNGGLQAWKHAGGTLDQEIITKEPSVFKLPVKKVLDMWIDKEALLVMMNSGHNFIIIDARSDEEFSGKTKKDGAAKAGRIPKSMHIDWAKSIDYEGTKKFRPIPKLEAIYN